MPTPTHQPPTSISGFSHHIFWSYNRDAWLPEPLVIKQVIAYGELPDLLLLSRRFSAAVVFDVIRNWKGKSRFRKRIHFMEKVILEK